MKDIIIYLYFIITNLPNMNKITVIYETKDDFLNLTPNGGNNFQQ